MRPDVGTQAQFRKKKAPATYRYDSSLSPALDWDSQNPAREQGEALIAQIRNATTLEEAKAAADKLAALGRPFLDWTGKAERLSFDVPTLPLFVHERLSTKAILESVQRHERTQQAELDLFSDPRHSVVDQTLRAYEHRDRWVNRMVLGDSLVVMNSLLHYEGLGGQVQMIYIDPPYGVKFGSNFQPFVRKRDVKHNDDGDMTREPEMVQAYRDTWELGLHSYLTYLRDRLLLARELLTPSGSVFVQIGDENLHHVREILDEVFGAENFVSLITFVKTSSATNEFLPAVSDYLIHFARDVDRVKFRFLYSDKELGGEGASKYTKIEFPDGTRRTLTSAERNGESALPTGGRPFRLDNLTSQSVGRTKGEGAASWFTVHLNDRQFTPGPTVRWKTNEEGMKRLIDARRVDVEGNSLAYVRYLEDFPAVALNNVWNDIGGIQSRSDPKIYAVQTATSCIQRCLLMTTDPGDLVLDPTCGSGTSAYVAEQWGRRWITVDTSRVPLALARQRLLTATYPWFELKDEGRGPAAGFAYKRKRNNKGEEVGGIVPHITLKSIANNEPPAEEVLVDRPETVKGITRVSGPFVFEATIPTPVDWEGDGIEDSGVPNVAESHGSFVERMLEVLRKSPVLRLTANQTIELTQLRQPNSKVISAEGLADDKLVAIVFGPESGAISEKLVYEAAREANAKHYTHLYVIGFAIQPNARELVERCVDVAGIPATYVQATPDVMMGDLLKNMRSSQIFSVCGLPDVVLRMAAKQKAGEPAQYEVEFRGLDVFDPVTMELDRRDGDDVPAWFLDTNYNELSFHVDQAFFPRTSAWDSLKRALKGTYEDSVWEHLAGTVSAPFVPGAAGKVAVKVIDDRGNELMVVREMET